MLARGDHTGRRVLCVFPRYTPSFGTFEFSYPLTDGVRAFMPPQGLLVIAAAVPPPGRSASSTRTWRPPRDEDFAWAEVVFVSGMHVQRRQIEDIRRRAHALRPGRGAGRLVGVGLPGALPGLRLSARRRTGRRHRRIVRAARRRRRRARRGRSSSPPRCAASCTEFPIPAYELAQIDRYLLGSIQFSSGCPYQCEFCDIPALYGRVARYKTAEQVCAELDKLVACGLSTSVYFVDDNFIANKRAVRELLPHLIEWQKRNGYPLLLSCEATLNIAKRPEILELMREAAFTTIFCGIETPDPEALKAISKEHNMMVPILGAIETLNGYGMEVVSGIIIGLDTDTPDTGRHLLEFVEQSQIPMLTMNLLQALPRTPLWDRLKREQRLIEDDDSRESNVVFRMPYDQVLAMWRECMRVAYQPETLFARYEHQIRATYPNRLRLPNSPQRASLAQHPARAAHAVAHLLARRRKGDYRRVFWRFALARLRRGEIEHLDQR